MAERHVFQRATVVRIIKETADTRTYVLAPHEKPFTYRAGQFCTFHVTVDGEELYRSYSMSSAPETSAVAVPVPAPPQPAPAAGWAAAWRPLAVPLFRALWVATVVSYIGTWAQEAGGPWLMRILTPDKRMLARNGLATSEAWPPSPDVPGNEPIQKYAGMALGQSALNDKGEETDQQIAMKG